MGIRRECMNIAIDFDGTFSRDPSFFIDVIDAGERCGHKFLIVTGRSDIGDMGVQVRRLVGDRVPIIFAGPDWKRDAVRKRGLTVDIWIDDSPEHVGPQNLIGRS